MEIKEITNKEIWENFLEQCEEKTFLDSWNWGEFNKKMGHKIWRWGVYESEELQGVALVIKIVAKRGTFLFAPHGPLLRSGNSKFEILNPKQIQNFKFQILNTLLDEIRRIAKEEKASFVRVAPILERNEENIKVFKDLGFKTAPIHMHPELTWELDITLSEDELLANMRKTTRYLIRKAPKDGVEIIQSKKLEDVEKFNALYKETVDRHHFVAFPPDYLKNQFLSFLPDDQILIFQAKYQGEIISSAIIVFWQDIAFYHHGASSAKFQKIPAAYTLLWEAIKEAKKRECKTFNFWGIAPISANAEMGNHKSQITNHKQIPNSNIQIQNKSHPWAGLTLFKMGFGGYPREYVKTQDYILSPKYWLTFVLEKIRKVKRGL